MNKTSIINDKTDEISPNIASVPLIFKLFDRLFQQLFATFGVRFLLFLYPNFSMQLKNVGASVNAEELMLTTYYSIIFNYLISIIPFAQGTHARFVRRCESLA